MGQISVTEAMLVHCGVVVPPIHNTRSWQTFTELCCLVCQQYFASKALQRRYHCLTLLFEMWKQRLMWVWVGAGVGVGVGVDFSKPESESESESLKFGRLRSPGSEAIRSYDTVQTYTYSPECKVPSMGLYNRFSRHWYTHKINSLRTEL